MINKISLENFKGFKQIKNMDIKPVTILCGTNSCGKSSILQSINLIRQTLENQDPKQPLLLNGRFVHLGAFKNIIFQHDMNENVSFEFSFKITRKMRLGVRPYYFILSEMRPEKSNRSSQIVDYYVHYKTSLKTTEKKSGGAYMRRPIRVSYCSFKVEAIDQNEEVIPGGFFEISHVRGNSYNLKWGNIRDRFRHFEDEGYVERISGEELGIVEFLNIFPSFVKYSGEKEKRSLRTITFLFHRAYSFLRDIFLSYTYIGPLREEPSRRYIYEEEVKEIGIKGENAAYFYFAEQDKSIENHYFYDNTNDSFVLKRKIRLSSAVQNWLDNMDIKNFKPKPLQEIIYLTLISSLSKKTRVNIADVGFGVSQIFPIILEGLRMPKGNTLLLEQPEIHLHPKMQMQMADYFIALALSGKKVIVETHSDHVVNRLVRRIVEDESGQLKDLIGICFIKPTESGAVFEEINIDSNQGITNWPVDFFDQTATEQEKIMRAGLKKRKKL